MKKKPGTKKFYGPIFAEILVVNPKEGEYRFWLLPKTGKSRQYLGHFEGVEWRKPQKTREAARRAGREMCKRLGWILIED